MFLKTEIRRRTEALNTYINQVSEKVHEKNYPEAMKHLQKNKRVVYDSYLAPYDPNAYYLDSLKSLRDKLCLNIQKLQSNIKKKNIEIETIKMRRGYQLAQKNLGKHENDTKNKNSLILNLTTIKEQEEEFYHKVQCKNVGIYTARFGLSLEDVNKVQYELVDVSTNFRTLRIHECDNESSQDKYISQIHFSDIITYSQCINHILFSCHASNYVQNYLILKFVCDEVKDKWVTIIKLCKIIKEAKLKKTRLFEPIQTQAKFQTNQIQLEQSGDNSDNNQVNHIIQFKNNQSSYFNQFDKNNLNSYSNHYQYNNTLHIPDRNLNFGVKASERLRRQSQFHSIGMKGDSKQVNKFRKGSEDLTLFSQKKGYLNTGKLNHFKSQKSFDDNVSHANSNITAKKEEKKNQFFQTPKDINHVSGFNKKLDKVYEQRKNLLHQNTPEKKNESHSGIFINSSTINWIQEEHEDQKSKSSFRSKNYQFSNHDQEKNLNQGNKSQAKQSQLISEDPAEIYDSPTAQLNKRSRTNAQQGGFVLIPVKNQHKDDYSDSPNANSSQLSDEFSNAQLGKKKTQMLGDDLKSPGQALGEQSPGQQSPISENEAGQQLSNNNDQQSSNQSEKTSQKFHLDELIKGIRVQKCSIDGWNSHTKLLYLSKNLKQLHWKDLKNNEVKKVLFPEIQKVSYQYADAGITKHIKKNIDPLKCLTIKCQKQKNKTKNLQFYLCDGIDPVELEIFSMNLSDYVEHRKYKF